MLKLRSLIRKRRGFRSGQKRPHKLDTVEAADDSSAHQISKSNSNQDITLLIPTTTPTSKITKKKVLFTILNHCKTDITQTKKKKQQTTSMPLHSRNLHDDFGTVQFSPIKISRTSESDSLSIDESDVFDTFIDEFKKNKQFLIMGRDIYPWNLYYLKKNTSFASDSELYFYDSIVDCYIPILLHKYEDNLHPFKGFSVDSIFISNINSNQSLEHVSYFLRYKVPEKDVFFPDLPQ